MRHGLEVIDEIRGLRVSGFTLTEIVNHTKIAKSTILPYINNIPLSAYLKEKIRLAKLDGQRRGATSRRGISIKNYSFLTPEKWNVDMVNLVAHFLFDGSITRTSCIYYNRSEILVNMMACKMRDLLQVSDYKTYTTPEGVKRVSYHNVEIATFIRRKAGELLEYIPKDSREHKISFLKAFFDDEGSVGFSRKKRRVRGYQHSIEILTLIKGLLKDLDIESVIDNRNVEISITRKENLLKFQKLINFTPGLCVNGNRSNSVWKKDLEKREILQMAIGSYL
ncbi:MAG: hypothetical protein A3C63_02355 [Candidatus Zambryskibacteria bacterium RIFCSPHIGHO2_02_FULL_39_82]|nr:MAG: hypothetical protein A3C63_02355 [Candidatus Zambryskibacteria bacterium RIFCSPHIGHO2_02_FULL_39_82]